MVIVNITGNLPQRSLKLYAEELRTQLMAAQNVRDVMVEGAYVPEFHVSIDPAKLRSFGNDSTIEINDSLHTLGGNLMLGMALVLIVLWLTLGLRNAMLTAVGIPFSFLCSILIMKINGVSLNSISLFAFVLVTGIMVDDAVIIVENIYRHFQMGKTKKAIR